MLRRALLAALLLLALPALATTTRVRTLGGLGDYFEDSSNVLRWYGSLVDYPQLAVLELGDWNHDQEGDFSDQISGRGGALHYRFDAAGRFGTAAIYFGEDLPTNDPGGWVSLLWARQFGPVAVGATFRGTSFSTATSGTELPLDGLSSFLHNLGLGLRWDLADNLYGDLAFEAMDTEVDYFSREDGISIENTGGWDSFGLRARLFHGLNDQAAAIYFVDWFHDVRPVADEVMDDLVDMDAVNLRAGVGFNLMPDPDNTLIFSTEYQSREEDRLARHGVPAAWDSLHLDWWSLDVRVGVESRLLPWLSLRGSASYRRLTMDQLYTTDWSDDFQEHDYLYDIAISTPVTLGLGLHFGRFDADLVFNDTTPFSLGYALTGGDRGDDANVTSITMSYGF